MNMTWRKIDFPQKNNLRYDNGFFFFKDNKIIILLLFYELFLKIILFWDV